MHVAVTTLGATHHGDVSEIEVSTQAQGRAENQELTVTLDGLDVASLPVTGAGTTKLVLNGHLLASGDHELRVTTGSGSSSAVVEQRLQVPVLDSVIRDTVADSLRRNQTPLVLTEALDSTLFDYQDPALTPWFDRPNARMTIAARRSDGSITPSRAQQLETFVSEGYLILEDAVPADLLGRLHTAVDDIVATGFSGYEWGSSKRVEHAHFHYRAMDELTRIDAVTSFLTDLFGATPRVCQTLTYIFGSQQGSHQDTIHLTPFPPGYMCGVWVALEDVQPGSGELAYYPRSHRLDRIYMNTVGCEKVSDGDWTQFGSTVVPRWQGMLLDGGFERVPFLPNAGTVLIWHENLMHLGVDRINPELSRKSVVTHYFADGPIAYYDSSGLPARFSHKSLAPDH